MVAQSSTDQHTAFEERYSIARLLDARHFAVCTDQGLAEEIRAWLAWRDEQRAQVAVLRSVAADGLDLPRAVVAKWDADVDFIFDARVRPIIDELERRVRVKRWEASGRPWLTTTELAASFPGRLRATTNGRYQARCPWHDDSQPSLTVFPNGWARCWVCNVNRPVRALAQAWKAQGQPARRVRHLPVPTRATNVRQLEATPCAS